MDCNMQALGYLLSKVCAQCGGSVEGDFNMIRMFERVLAKWSSGLEKVMQRETLEVANTKALGAITNSCGN